MLLLFFNFVWILTYEVVATLEYAQGMIFAVVGSGQCRVGIRGGVFQTSHFVPISRIVVVLHDILKETKIILSIFISKRLFSPKIVTQILNQNLYSLLTTNLR